jgi:hypothetical protein
MEPPPRRRSGENEGSLTKAAVREDLLVGRPEKFEFQRDAAIKTHSRISPSFRANSLDC